MIQKKLGSYKASLSLIKTGHYVFGTTHCSHNSTNRNLASTISIRNCPLRWYSTESSPALASNPIETMKSSDYNTRHKNRFGGGWLWLIPAVTLGLGIWQVQRLQWKLHLIDQAQSRIHQIPRVLSCESAKATVPSRDQFTRVTVTGTFLHDKEIMVGPRVFHADTSQDQGGGILGGGKPDIGYFIFTPMVIAESSVGAENAIVLINRGWIPKDECDRPHRKAITGLVTVDGVIRDGEPCGKLQSWTISNKPEKGEWYSIDLEKISQWTGSLPIIVQMVSDSPINQKFSPNNGQPYRPKVHAKLRNNHMEYAITWFGLCAVSTLMLASKKRIFRKR
ncbi:surf-like protein [Batrachochytrium dendrobatidis]|nr:surf-like protein [Batrachochytrium dendrobatidis]KAK5672962.1 surf-like protein [Batrachochytrium dendrobatidis]